MQLTFHVEVERDGEYLTIWCGNDLICVGTHYSEVPELYLNYIKSQFPPDAKLIDYEVPAPLRDWNHESWFVEDS